MYITGTDLRRMRHDAGLTTVKMANLAKVKTRKTYENWEKNVGAPNMNQFIDLCLGCNYNPAKFVKMVVDNQDSTADLDVFSARR